MSQEHSHHDIDQQVRIYIAVFVALMGLTVITVGISYLHLAVVPSIILALIIASIKASLVAAFFMHLISERKLIYAALTLTVVFFIVLMFLPVGQYLDGYHL